MSQISEKFTVRPAKKEDVEALYAIFNEYWQMLTGFEKFTLDNFQRILSTPGFDIESSTLLIQSPEDVAVASGLVIDLGSPPIHPQFFGCVREGYEGLGLGSHLLQWGEHRARKAIERCPENARVSMYVQTSQSHPPSIDLLEKAGLNAIRYSWFMINDLAEAPPEPVWPKGIKMTSYQEYNDLEAILRANDEAFEDHWGYVDRSGDKERIERFRHSHEEDENFDPAIWYLAMEDDEIAGLALCSSHLGPDEETGVVDILGVRRPWRRQGLGLALLHYAFGEFLLRGYKRVGLGVDSENFSGATRLYEKAGMQVVREFTLYEKELRSGEELSKQSE